MRAFRLPSRPRIGYGALHFGPCEYHIKVTGFEPMALCTQNRCADQTALHLVSPPEHMVWIYPIEKDSNRSRPPRGTGRREPPLLGNKPKIGFSSRFTCIFFRSVSLSFMSGIEPLTPFGFTVQRAQAQRTKEDLQSHAHCPARTINTGIDPLNTHTISI